MGTLVLHHLIQSLFLPPVNGVWIALLGLIKFRSRAWLISCFSCALVFVYLQFTPFMAGLLSRFIYPSFDNLMISRNYQAQAIVVLGAGSGVEIDEFGELHGFPVGFTLLNVESAAVVAKNNPQLPLILSGGSTNQYFSEASSMQHYLQEHYALVNEISVENRSMDTDENARYTAQKLAELRFNRVILVTQASHMWRSVALFNKYGIECNEYPAWDLYSTKPLWWQNFIPEQSAVIQTKKLIHELIGYVGDVVF